MLKYMDKILIFCMVASAVMAVYLSIVNDLLYVG
jgi:hypothetical protein